MTSRVHGDTPNVSSELVPFRLRDVAVVIT